MSEIRILHTSDLHIGSDTVFWTSRDKRAYSSLEAVLLAGRRLNIDLLVVAGDLFDSPRVSEEELRIVASMLRASGLSTIILPGNHDCLVSESAYIKHFIPEMAPNVKIIGAPDGESVPFPQLDLAVWGRPHIDYSDFSPMASIPGRGPEKWQIAVAHGLYVQEGVHDGRGWKITEADIVASERDYVALGHLEMFNRVGKSNTSTYYSGSPNQTGAAVLVEFGGEERVSVSQVPLFLATDGPPSNPPTSIFNSSDS